MSKASEARLAAEGAAAAAHAAAEASRGEREAAREAAEAVRLQLLAEREGKASLAAECTSLRAQAEEARAAVGALRERHATVVEELDELKGAVRVFCRVRPLHAGSEAQAGTAVAPSHEPHGVHSRSVAVRQAPSGGSKAFDFDRVFDGAHSTDEVFDELRPLTRKVAHQGGSATILAYGQTGSGKTHTVGALHALVVSELLSTAAPSSITSATPASAPASAARDGPPRLALSMSEVYMDHVKDLAKDCGPPGAEGVLGGAQPTSAAASAGELPTTWLPVHDAAAAAALVASAVEMRRTADNGINAASSRSHLIIIYALLGPNGERLGQLALVDLAGSERLSRTEATGSPNHDPQVHSHRHSHKP